LSHSEAGYCFAELNCDSLGGVGVSHFLLVIVPTQRVAYFKEARPPSSSRVRAASTEPEAAPGLQWVKTLDSLLLLQRPFSLFARPTSP
jgi:hypothetical protein